MMLPNAADAVVPRRKIVDYLLSATRHLIDSLRRLRKAQNHESAFMLNIASGEMALLRFELMGYGIS